LLMSALVIIIVIQLSYVIFVQFINKIKQWLKNLYVWCVHSFLYNLRTNMQLQRNSKKLYRDILFFNSLYFHETIVV